MRYLLHKCKSKWPAVVPSVCGLGQLYTHYGIQTVCTTIRTVNPVAQVSSNDAIQGNL